MDLRQKTRRDVLVVEDDPDFAALLATNIRRLGHDARIAYDGGEAMKDVESSPPDLITLDLAMPQKSGTYFFRQLRASNAYRQIPIIVVTGLTRDDPVARAVVSSFLNVEHVAPPEAYMDKPIDLDQLAGLLQKHLASEPSPHLEHPEEQREGGVLSPR